MQEERIEGLALMSNIDVAVGLDGWRGPIRSTVTFPALLTLEMTENMVSFADLYRAGSILLRLEFQE